MLRFLIIDYDPVSTFITSRLIARLDKEHTITAVSDNDAALEYLKQSKLSHNGKEITLLNLTGDAIESFSFFKRTNDLFDKSTNYPIIFGMSNYSYHPFDITALKQQGILRILTKPFQTNYLDMIIKDSLSDDDLSITA